MNTNTWAEITTHETRTKNARYILSIARKDRNKLRECAGVEIALLTGTSLIGILIYLALRQLQGLQYRAVGGSKADEVSSR